MNKNGFRNIDIPNLAGAPQQAQPVERRLRYDFANDIGSAA
jgi:hypothetical protein